jgi:hypothetical protein
VVLEELGYHDSPFAVLSFWVLAPLENEVISHLCCQNQFCTGWKQAQAGLWGAMLVQPTPHTARTW